MQSAYVFTKAISPAAAASFPNSEEETMLQEAGFSNVSLFYAGFSFKGWLSYAD